MLFAKWQQRNTSKLRFAQNQGGSSATALQGASRKTKAVALRPHSKAPDQVTLLFMRFAFFPEGFGIGVEASEGAHDVRILHS